MTQISDNASLQSAVTEYLARDQDVTLIARIPTFIQLAEAKFNRQLFVRQMEQRSTALVNTASSEREFVSLPVDFQSMRRVRLSSVTGKPGLEFKSGTQIHARNFSEERKFASAQSAIAANSPKLVSASSGSGLHATIISNLLTKEDAGQSSSSIRCA